MTLKEKAKKLYAGKFFYIIHSSDKDTVVLSGARDDIYYIAKTNTKGLKIGEYSFVQVIDGKPVQAFKENEILVTTRRL